MKLLLCLWVFLCPAYTIAQTGDAAPRLLVGDTVPDVRFSEVLNYKGTTAHLTDFKKKLLVIDFWSGFCGGCLHKFPLIDSIIKRYPDEVGALLVSSYFDDKRVNTEQLFKRLNKGRNKPMAMPVILGDTVLNQLFRHLTIPHYIWLNSDLKVIAVTGSEDMTFENVDAYLKGKTVSFGAKDIMENFDVNQPLFLKGNGGAGEQIKSRSILTGFLPGMPSMNYTSTNKNKLVTKLISINQPVAYLLMEAHQFYDPPSRLLYETGDTVFNPNGKSDEWLTAHSYSYELITPPISRARALQYMQQDIQRWLGVTARIDTVETSCYVLTTDSRYNGKNTIELNGKRSEIKEDLTGEFLLKDFTMSRLAELLDEQLPLHVLDETGRNLRVNMRFPPKEGIEDYQYILKYYGLRLEKAIRPLPNLFIYHQPN